ncbi:MAG TPA: GNAT family N-acetyltransferase [Solirubrobacterales bacterium]|jgi:GNAT superfamily N-acetyltransferase|nr:GNAT family N-acetyltransferase [Solirubrobacterales bacterium]
MDAKATRSETPDRDELLAFELGLDERVCDEIHRLPWGRLFLTRSLPLIWDSNWVGIEQTGLSVEQLVAIGDDALGGEGFGHRTIVPLDEADGKRVGAEVEAEPDRWPRWEVERNRYMVWRGAEDEPVSSQKVPDSGTKCELIGAREVRLAEIEGLRRAITIEESIPNDIPQPEETAEQLLELDRRYGVAGGDRWFAAPAEGEPLSCCRLLRGGSIAQVEDVGTLARGRERGYAKAVVRAAIAAARAEAAATIFLIADGADWPQLLYGKLGFETVGEITILRRRP